ncbi:hypothetical protein FO519_008864 [Halicephalobus sp. NKZ332]|nr:hypothetical protein FO519_008864 [Halicephalobus sp. NKZ332]
MGNRLSYQGKLRKFKRYMVEDFSSTSEMSDLITAVVQDTICMSKKEDFKTSESCQKIADEIIYGLWSTSGGLWRCLLGPPMIDFNKKPRPRNFVKFEIFDSKRVPKLDIVIYQELTSDQFNPACAQVNYRLDKE